MSPLSALIILPIALIQAPTQQEPEISLPVDQVEEAVAEPVLRDRTLDDAMIDELVERARASLAEDRFPEAVELYTEVSDRLPNDQRFQYNLGVASYRSGDLESAARCFERAATTGDPALTQSALFNRGTTTYRRALDAVQAAQSQQTQQRSDGTAVDPALLDDPIEALQQAIMHYRDAIAASTDNRDARRNAELAHRLMKALQQQQDQQQQDQQQQEQQQQDQQQQDQQQQDQQQQDQQQQDQQQQDQQQQDQQQQDQQQQDQQQQEQQQQDQQQQDQQQQAAESAQGTASEQPVRMTEEQAEALLQMIRDREKQRRQVLAEREAREAARRYRPVEKDW